MVELFRYAAFISYSSKDEAFAQRLHRALEGYAVPAALGAFDLLGGGGKPNRIYPVFRDREELSAGGLGDRIEAALEASGALIVVCSPHAAASPWVQKEMAFFASLGRRDRIFAIIADNAPLLGSGGADATSECFPPAFRSNALNDAASLEPLAADARRGKDGFRNAWLKIVAGLIGVAPGQLADRDRRRRRAQRLGVAAGVAALALTVAISTAWVDAQTWRTRASTYAEAVANQGRPLDALPFAVAGLAAPGALIHARSDRAAAVLARVSGPVSRDLGHVRAYLLSANGAVLVVQTEGGGGFYYDLARSARRDLDLHRDDELVALSANGAALIVKSVGGAAVHYDLARGGAKRDLGGWLATAALSDNGAALAVYHPEGRVAYHDIARGGGPRDLGKVGPLGFSFTGSGARGMAFSANGAILVVQGSDPLPEELDTSAMAAIARLRSARTSYFDFRNGASARRDLGWLVRYAVSDDGARLMTHAADGEGELYALNGNAAPRNFGPLRTFEFARNGAMLVTRSLDGRAAYFDLRRDAAAHDLGPVRTLALSDLGESLVTVSQDGALTHYDLADGGTARRLGRIDAFAGDLTLSRNGATLLTTEPLRGAAYYDLAGGAAPRTLANWSSPSSSELLLAADGSALVIRDREGNLVAYDLAAGGQRRVLGSMERPRFDTGLRLSDNGAVLVTQTDDRSAAFYDLAREGVRRDLGLLESYALAPDGSALAVRSVDGNGALYQIATPGSAASASGTPRRTVCAASGDAMRPFSHALRRSDPNGGRSDTDQRLFNDLRGRPSNPCDWRGLGAILPDGRTGDGWFEGPRQWLRLISVRFFGTADWTCEEGVSAASAETRARRREMCGPTELEAGDQT